jgi:MFS family permease
MRILQGAAGALVAPQVLAIIGTTYAGHRRGRAFAAYGFAMGIAAVVGQVLGGALIQADVFGSGWRGIFLINVPVGVGTLLGLRALPETYGHPAQLDLGGTALVTLSVTALVLPLVEGREHGWPAWTWLSFFAAPALLAGFVVHQRDRVRAGQTPLVDLGLFRNNAFRVGSLAGLTFSMVAPSFFFVLALYLQQGRGFGPLHSGEVFIPVGVGYFLALVVAAPISTRLGRQGLALGALTVAVGCLTVEQMSTDRSVLALLPGLAIVGFGIGLVLVPLTSIVLAGIDPLHAGAASGVMSTAQQVGGALGVAVIGVVFFAALGAGQTAYQHAFTVSLVVLAGLTLATAALVQLLPRGGAEAAG